MTLKYRRLSSDGEALIPGADHGRAKETHPLIRDPVRNEWTVHEHEYHPPEITLPTRNAHDAHTHHTPAEYMIREGEVPGSLSRRCVSWK
jgi:hypothetical protein